MMFDVKKKKAEDYISRCLYNLKSEYCNCINQLIEIYKIPIRYYCEYLSNENLILVIFES